MWKVVTINAVNIQCTVDIKDYRVQFFFIFFLLYFFKSRFSLFFNIFTFVHLCSCYACTTLCVYFQHNQRKSHHICVPAAHSSYRLEEVNQLQNRCSVCMCFERDRVMCPQGNMADLPNRVVYCLLGLSFLPYVIAFHSSPVMFTDWSMGTQLCAQAA